MIVIRNSFKDDLSLKKGVVRIRKADVRICESGSDPFLNVTDPEQRIKTDTLKAWKTQIFDLKKCCSAWTSEAPKYLAWIGDMAQTTKKKLTV